MSDNWRDWLQPIIDIRQSPYAHDIIEIKRIGEDKATMVCPRSLAPELNVYNLMWRPVE